MDQFEHDDTRFPQTTLTLQNLGSKEEDVVVGAEEPGGDPTLKLALADQEIGHLETKRSLNRTSLASRSPSEGIPLNLARYMGTIFRRRTR